MSTFETLLPMSSVVRNADDMGLPQPLPAIDVVRAALEKPTLTDETIQDLAVDFGLNGESTFDALGFARAVPAAKEKT